MSTSHFLLNSKRFFVLFLAVFFLSGCVTIGKPKPMTAEQAMKLSEQTLDSKVSALGETADIQSTDLFLLVDGATSKKITAINVFDMIDTSAKLFAIVGNETGGTFLVGSASPTFTGTVIAASIDASGTISADQFNPDVADEGTLGTADLEFSNAYFSDESIVYFGDDQDVYITHVENTGLRLILDNAILFGDNDVFIESDDDGYLDLDADTGIRFNGPMTSTYALDGTIATTVAGGETGLYYNLTHATNALTGELVGVKGNARVNAIDSAAGSVIGGYFTAGNTTVGTNLSAARGIYTGVTNKVPSGAKTWTYARGIEVNMDLDQGTSGNENTITNAAMFYGIYNLPSTGAYATVTNGYGAYFMNEAITGAGQTLDAIIYGADKSMGVAGWDFGIDFSGIAYGSFGTADIRGVNSETIDNNTDGSWDFGAAIIEVNDVDVIGADGEVNAAAVEQNAGTDITADLEEETHAPEHIEATGADPVSNWTWGGALEVGDATPPIKSGYVYDCTGATDITITDFYGISADNHTEFTAGKTRFRVWMNKDEVTIDFSANANIEGNADTNFVGHDSQWIMLEFLYVGTGFQCTNLYSGMTNALTMSAKVGRNHNTFTGNDDITDDEAYNYTHYVTGAGGYVIGIPAVGAYHEFSIRNHTAGDVNINPNGSEIIILNGVALDAGDSIVGTDIGDGCSFEYFAADTWAAYCVGYEDAGD